MAVQLRALSPIGVVALCCATYYVACWLVAMMRRDALVCWTVGPLGITAVYLREPPRGLLVAQVWVPALLVACASYMGLSLVHPLPLVPVPLAVQDPQMLTRLGTVALVVLAVGGVQCLRLLADRRCPLWGDARVLVSVQRSRALGALVHFTPVGRAFLRERFGITPSELLHLVRRA